MNRKGDLGQILTTPVVLILIVVLGFIFIFLSSSLASIIGPADVNAYPNEERNYSFLFKEVNISGNELWVIEAVVKMERGEFSSHENYEGFRRLVNEDNPCLLIASSKDYTPVPSNPNSVSGDFYFKYNDDGYVGTGNKGSVHNTFQEYKRQGFFEYAYLHEGEETISIAYHYGKCIGGDNE